MKKRLLTRAFSAAVITTVVSSGLIVGASTGARAEPPGVVPANQQLAEAGLLDFLTDDPVLLGTGVVGEPLDVIRPVFGLLSPLLQGLVSTDVTWLCDGEEVPGVGNVLEFVPTEAQAGCEMAAETVSSLLGLVPLSLVTNAIPIGVGDELPDSLLDVLTANPILLGTGAVGDPLSVVAPVFGLLSPLLQGLITTEVSWLCDGEAIPGVGNVFEFVPTEAQAGCQMVVQTVSTLLGLLPLSLLTNLIDIPGGVTGAPQATTAAHLAGTPKVGQTLTVTDPVWDTTGVTNTYAWIRNGVAIPGAAAKTYKVSAQDAGKQITAKVTGTKSGKSGTSVSNALLISNEAVEQLVATVAPRISGGQRVGGLMRIDPGQLAGRRRHAAVLLPVVQHLGRDPRRHVAGVRTHPGRRGQADGGHGDGDPDRLPGRARHHQRGAGGQGGEQDQAAQGQRPTGRDPGHPRRGAPDRQGPADGGPQDAEDGQAAGRRQRPAYGPAAEARQGHAQGPRGLPGQRGPEALHLQGRTPHPLTRRKLTEKHADPSQSLRRVSVGVAV